MIDFNGKKYFTEKEVSQKYGLSRSWLQKARHKKESPMYYKLQGKVLYNLEHIDQWLKDHLTPFK